MFSTLSQVAYRTDVLRLKTLGRLPQFSWLDVGRTWTTSSNGWPCEKLALPVAEEGELAGYNTPIGTLWWTKSLRRYAGLLALEHVRGVYERGAVRVNVGDVVIDLGGHIGSFTRYAFSRGASAVVMFEPEPEHIRCVEHCFATEINNGRLRLIRAAAWNENTTVRFARNGIESRVQDSGELEVLALTVDRVVDSLKLRRVDFIKADIEGAEPFALDGAKNTIRRFMPKMALCTYHFPDHPMIIPAIVKTFASYEVAFNVGRAQAFFMPLCRERVVPPVPVEDERKGPQLIRAEHAVAATS